MSYVDEQQNLELGAHAIINRTFADEKPMETGAELAMLRDLQLPADRCGVAAFNGSAQPLYGKLLSKNIPVLRNSLKAKQTRCLQEDELRLGTNSNCTQSHR